MAGHCSTHTHSSQNPMGNESFGHHGLPAAVQGQGATSRMPVAVVPYPSSFPFIHPLTNQVMMRAPSCLALPSPCMPFWMMAQLQIQAPPQAQLICGTVLHSYTVMSWHGHAATAVVASPRHAYSANQPGAAQADLTLRLGSGGGGDSRGDKR
ncbi:unnamed protein product [Miscanthus lutarioriparius]|uniref:Uncharacterized protein n=1 Tax=Miscanthus lutarioriparius TaxID=422564 RepID=A0A811S346_9POAL|nr:unnamed protein product [Miscanthus lutarioriparius]